MPALKEIQKLVVKPSSNTKRVLLVALALYLVLYYILNKYLTFPADVEAHLKTLQPLFQAKVRLWLARTKEKLGLDVVITSSRRTYAQQAALYAQDNRNAKPDKDKPNSHMLGLAVDVNFKRNGSIVLRKATPAYEWAPVVDLAKRSGIKRWGGTFNGYPDNVHFDDI